VLDRLRELGELGNTCVVLTSDNGSRFGEHSLVMGKNTAYEEDLGTPLYVNGPGVVATAPEEMALNVDLAPTFSEWGGAAFAGDGRSLAPVLRGERVPWRERLMVESWTVEGSRYHEYIPRYEGVRERGRVYVEYPEAGERELYHLDADPFRMENRLHEATPEAEAEASALAARLGALKNCAGETCRGAENP
jgi:N-acetylglucosamine-6-sulfatase